MQVFFPSFTAHLLIDPKLHIKPIYRVYKIKVDNFETALNLAKRLEV